MHFEEMGAKRLHLVDLDGARTGSIVNLHVLEAVAGKTSLQIDFGGGVQTDADLRRAFDAGADMVTAGSVAVKEPDRVRKWLQEYGPARIILGADVRKGRIAVRGWQEDTRFGLNRFIRSWRAAGITQVICTDIELDGMLQGPECGLYRDLKSTFPDLKIIASGGVSGMHDIKALEESGVDGAIFGKAYYEGKITGTDIRNYLKKV